MILWGSWSAISDVMIILIYQQTLRYCNGKYPRFSTSHMKSRYSLVESNSFIFFKDTTFSGFTLKVSTFQLLLQTLKMTSFTKNTVIMGKKGDQVKRGKHCRKNYSVTTVRCCQLSHLYDMIEHLHDFSHHQFS